MKIAEMVVHEGVQTITLKQWVERGHEIHLVEGGITWNTSFGPVPEGVRTDKPSRPDLVTAGTTPDLLRAHLYNLRRFRPWSPTVMVHHALPSHHWMAGPLYRRSTNVTLCPFAQQYLKDLWGVDSEVIYCPIDTDIYRPQGRKVDRKRVIAIGNGFTWRPEIGWKELKEVMELVHRQDPAVRFEIVGINPEIDPADFPNVETTALKHNDLPGHEATARCVIFPAIRTQIPQSLIGAMALGKAVVAFELGTISNLVVSGRSGYLVPKFDTAAFADRVLALTNSDEDPVLSSNARARILEKCDHRRVADQYEALFQSLAD